MFKLEFIEHSGKENVATYIIQAEKAIADMTDVRFNMSDGRISSLS